MTTPNQRSDWPAYSVKDVYDDGCCAYENGSALPNVDPYDDPELFQSFKNGWKACDLMYQFRMTKLHPPSE